MRATTRQITVTLANETVAELDALVAEKNSEFIGRADVVRAVLETGLKWMRKNKEEAKGDSK